METPIATQPLTLTTNADEEITFDLEQLAAFGRETIKILAGPSPWDSDTTQALGETFLALTGIDFDRFLGIDDEDEPLHGWL